MAQTNIKKTEFTHEGAPAKRISVEKQLYRSVMSCLLWEKEFYEDGEDIAKRILKLCEQVESTKIADMAYQARHEMHLRHVPLLLLCAIVRKGHKKVTEPVIEAVISRADEMGEFISLYWSLPGNKHMIPHAMQRGLQRAIVKFDEYQLAKYDRDSANVKLRDVFRLVRPRPGEWYRHPTNKQSCTNLSKKLNKEAAKEQKDLWGRAVKGELKTPDTWEVALSGGADKKETFERLIMEGKLGYFALLRNLRNMAQAGVDEILVSTAITDRKNGADRVLPFRFIAAARAAPRFERELDQAMIAGLGQLPELKGRTAVLVDVSGSMDGKLSGKSDLKRIDAAAALASIINAEKLRTFTFSHHLCEVPPRRGMAGVDVIIRSQQHVGTYLGNALRALRHEAGQFDRLIVITDEQSHDLIGDPWMKHAYMINVASAKNGVGYGKWNHINGFSENVLRWIHMYEASDGSDKDQ